MRADQEDHDKYGDPTLTSSQQELAAKLDELERQGGGHDKLIPSPRRRHPLASARRDRKIESQSASR